MTVIAMEENSFKRSLADNEQSLGLWSSLCSIIAAEVVSDAGFDWLLFDSEHSPVEIAGLLPLLQASSRGGSHAAVRVAWNDPVLIKRVLDIGAQTIFAPFIQNADEACTLVKACLYPPNGIRGMAGSTRANRFGRCLNYINEANDNLCIIAQIETELAIKNIPEIAGVEHIDGIFVGPSDLSASLGYPGNSGHPYVQARLQEALSAIREAGKPAGILATCAEDAKKYFQWGFTFVAAGVDVRLLADSADSLVSRLKDGE